MKILKCSDIGIRDSYQVTGYNDEEVINKMYNHIKKAHPVTYDKIINYENHKIREKMKKILKNQKP